MNAGIVRVTMAFVFLGIGILSPTAQSASLAERFGKSALEKLAPELLKVPDRIDIPVSWRQTRARFRPSGASTQTESFRETWRLSKDGSGGGWLESGRAKVRVLKKGQTGGQAFSLIIDEKALGKLLGIIKSEWNAEEGDQLPPPIYQLDLAAPGEVLKLVLNLSEEEHYTIQLQIGQVDLRSI
jgi:hypothetical protein